VTSGPTVSISVIAIVVLVVVLGIAAVIYFWRGE
jgi:hypothetical protein